MIADAQSAPVPPEPAAQVGDLTRLVFTATEPLSVRFVSPLPTTPVSGTSEPIEVSTGSGGGVELRVNGETLPFSDIGKRTIARNGDTCYTYYGVTLQPGENTLVATPLGAAGRRGAPVSETVYGPSRPTHFALTVAGALRADGATPVSLTVTGLDPWNHPARAGSMVRLSIVEGDAHFLASSLAHPAAQPTVAPSTSTSSSLPFAVPSADPSAPSTALAPEPSRLPADSYSSQQSIELPLDDNGAIVVPVLPGLRSGTLRIRATSAEGAFADLAAFVRPSLRLPLVAGIATAGVGQIPSVPGDELAAPDGPNSRRGRIAIYGTGAVGGNTLGTIAYDTASALTPSTTTGPYVTDPNDRQYATYGDSSIRRNDALSNDHLYLRLDNDRNTALWGNFQAQTGGPTSAGGFNLLVHGAKLDLATSATKLSAFNAHNDVAYARLIVAPSGTGTLGELLHPDIVIGSDTITLVTLSRTTGLVLNQTTLIRNVDYTLDYTSGSLSFIVAPLPFDSTFNPQQILIQYEYGGSGVDTQTTGGRFDTVFGRSQRTHFGVGYVNQATGVSNFSLSGQDLSGSMSGGTWSLSHLSSAGSVPTSGTTPSLAAAAGSAYHAAYARVTGPNQISATFDSANDAFENPFGGLSTPGLLNYHAALVHRLGSSKDDLALTFDHEQNLLPGNASSQSTAALTLHETLTPRFRVTLGTTVLDGPVTNPAAALVPVPQPPPPATLTGTTVQGHLGFDWHLFPAVTLSVDRATNIGSLTSSSQPAQTTAQINIDFPKKGALYVRELWSAPTQSFAATTSTFTAPSATGSHSTAVGFQRALTKTTAIDSQYVLDQTSAGSDLFSAIGVKQTFALGARLKGDASFHRATAVGSGIGSYQLYGVSAAYSDGSRFRASTSYQLRTGYQPASSLTLGLAGSISPDISIQSTIANSNSIQGSANNARVGIAWRPSRNDRGATLLEYDRQDGTLSTLGAQTDTASIEQVYRPTGSLELAARYAYELDGDAYYPARTTLTAFRLRQSIGSRLDVGGEASLLSMHDVPNAQQAGVAAEVGYRLGDTLRVAAGYNFSGSPDPYLATAPTRRGAYVTVTTVVDRLFGWGKRPSLAGAHP